jgi:hypothetical protein
MGRAKKIYFYTHFWKGLLMEILIVAENGFDFSIFFYYGNCDHAALIDPNLIRILKPVGQYNLIISSHQNQIDQSISNSMNSYER